MTDSTNPNHTATPTPAPTPTEPQVPELPADWEERSTAYERHFVAAADALVAAIRCEVTDGAETISHLLATAAANLGGMHTLTVGRPGSWEADYVDRFLASTVGPAGEYLLAYRTAPIEIVECIDQTMADLGIINMYGDSLALIDEIEGPAADGADDHATAEAASARVSRAIELLNKLEERDYASYKAEFERQVQVAAAELRRTRYLPEPVPVSVRWVDWEHRAEATADQEVAWAGISVEQELWELARVRTPPPGFADPLNDVPGPRLPGEILRDTGRMPHQRIPELAHYPVDAGTRAADGGDRE